MGRTGRWVGKTSHSDQHEQREVQGERIERTPELNAQELAAVQRFFEHSFSEASLTHTPLSIALDELRQVEQELGEVLGYPRYTDDPVRFPGATAADGVNTGGAGAYRLARQAAKLIRALQYEVARKGE